MPYSEIADDLGLNPGQVAKRVLSLGLYKKQEQYDWKMHPESDEFIRNNIAHMSNAQMAASLGLRKMQVEKRVMRLRKKRFF
jgi:DNA-binding Lrp family transcriptional regulator